MAVPAKSEDENPPPSQDVRLKRVLGPWDATAYIVCSIIGSGIFVSPKGVLLRTGSSLAALGMWAATGAVNLVVSFCYAELALTFPQAGSEYTYIRRYDVVFVEVTLCSCCCCSCCHSFGYCYCCC